MKLVGPEFLGRFAGPRGQHAPGAVPVVPRYVGPGGRARLRGEGHRRDAVRRRRGRRHRPDHRPDGGARGGRATTSRPCTNGSRSPSGPCSSTPWAGSPAKASPSPTGRCGSADERPRTAQARAPTTGSRSGGPWSRVYDKSGLEDLVRGLHDAGVELVSTGGSAKLIADLGLPVTKVEDLTGFPECLDGRVKTLHPKVHAGILADRRLPAHVAQLAELGVEPFDLVVSNLYPFTADGDVGRLARRVRRADRHRRALDGAGGGQEPPLGRDRHLARALRRRARRARRGWLHPRAAQAPGRGGVRAHRDVRRGTWPAGWAAC